MDVKNTGAPCTCVMCLCYLLYPSSRVETNSHRFWFLLPVNCNWTWIAMDSSKQNVSFVNPSFYSINISGVEQINFRLHYQNMLYSLLFLSEGEMGEISILN